MNANFRVQGFDGVQVFRVIPVYCRSCTIWDIIGRYRRELVPGPLRHPPGHRVIIRVTVRARGGFGSNKIRKF